MKEIKVNKLFAQNLNKIYDLKEVVRDISIELHSGEIVGLLGPNGAGKTTSFYIIMGLISPNSGRIFLNEKDISKFPMYKRARVGIGYLPQESSVFGKLTVWDNLWGVAEYLALSTIEQKGAVERALSEMKIAHLANQKAYTLSGGERRRLEIARILITSPKFLLMDEPFSGVDPISINDLQRIIIELKNKNIGILITDHNVRETLKIVDHAYLIHDGKILCHGSSDVLLSDENSRKFYLGEDFNI